MNKSPFEPTKEPPPHGSGGLRLAPFWKRSMDDATSASAGEPFDALADLFLGEVASRPASRKAMPTPTDGGAAQVIPPAGDDDGPKLRLAGSESDEEAPVPHAATQEAIAPRPTRPVLAFATSEDGEARSVRVTLPAPVRNPVMECVVLANLPVIGAAWASQYVREVASAAAKLVACLRVEGDFVRLELVGSPPEGAEVPKAEEIRSLESAIDAAAELTDRWIVRCDTGQEGVVAACGMTRAMTVLSGSDPIAREACRPVFERLSGALGEPVGDESPMIRLALMGAASAEASAIGQDLAKAAEQTMKRPVTAVVCSTKIGAVRAPHLLFSGTGGIGLKAMLDLVHRAVSPDGVGMGIFMGTPAKPTAATQPAEDRPVRTEAAARIERVQADLSETVSASPVEDPAPSVEIAATPPPLPTRMTVDEAPPARVEQPQPAKAQPPLDTPPSIATSAPALLASHIAELKPLAFTCPYARGVELAIDGSGGLHLLARAASEEAQEHTLASLMVAATWAESHASLLAAAAHARFENVAKPTMHLFTSEAKRSRRLLDTSLRVHLLAQVSVAGQSGWFCTELN